MRFIISFVFLSFTLFSLSCSNKQDNDTVFMYVERMPSFPGGDSEMMKYIRTNLRYPKVESEEDISGYTCVVKFIVRRSGEITDIEITRSISDNFDKEVIKLIESMPQWVPGEMNGAKVSCYYRMPIHIHLKK